jgi:hypothetical protein
MIFEIVIFVFNSVLFFQELLDIRADPSCKVKVASFGFKAGHPVVAEFLVEGTVGTHYAGALFPLRVTFQVTMSVCNIYCGSSWVVVC